MILKTLAALLVLASASLAHDFWLQPSTFQPVVGERIDVRFLVGEHFVGDEVGRKEERILSFVAVDSGGREEKILGRDGRAPAGMWRPSAPGLYVLGYRGNGTTIELEAEKFEHYLVSEGLEHVVAERKRLGESDRKGRESYARCPKSFVVATAEAPLTDAQRKGWDRTLGYPLEIVPTVDPLHLAPDAQLAVRVLHQGAPLANALVGCMPKSDPKLEVRLRTDAEGRVAFAPTSGGVHMLRVVHMTRAAEGLDHDWESHWASLTFELPQRAPKKE